MTEQEKKDAFFKQMELIFDRPVTAETTVRAELNATSMQCFMMLAEIEELGAKGVEYLDIKNCVTLGDIADLMIEKTPA